MSEYLFNPSYNNFLHYATILQKKREKGPIEKKLT